jgi:hypothetical protein
MSKDERKEYLNRQSSSKNKTSHNNETDQNLPGTSVARRSESQSAERSARELAIDVFRGKGTEGRKHLADGSESIVERVGEDWAGYGRDLRAVRHQDSKSNITAARFAASFLGVFRKKVGLVSAVDGKSLPFDGLLSPDDTNTIIIDADA